MKFAKKRKNDVFDPRRDISSTSHSVPVGPFTLKIHLGRPCGVGSKCEDFEGD